MLTNNPNKSESLFLIKQAAIILFSEIEKKYNFKICTPDFLKDTYDTLYVVLEKNHIYIYIYINLREGFEICLKGKDSPSWRYINTTALRKLKGFRDDIKMEFDLCNKVFEKYSFEWYKCLISNDLKFIEKNFSEIFENGVLPELAEQNEGLK